MQPGIDVAALALFLDEKYGDARRMVRANLAECASVLEEAETLSRAEFCERVKELLLTMAATGQTGMGFPEEYGGGGDVGASVASFETLAYGDLSVLVKIGVQFGLFGGAILQLGTQRHHDAYLADLITGRLMGCFAMTVTGHGSNVQALGTVETYDPATDEFVVTTRDETSGKDYIGNAAEHADVGVVFAQLEVGAESHGVHAFVVPLREDRRVLPGVRIADDGLKMGLNAVDNGRIWFDGVRIPRGNLLNHGIDDGIDDGEVFSRVQDHVIAASRAHVERLMLEAFVERVRAMPDGDHKVALTLLCDLHALTTIEKDRGWFMEHGRLSSPRSKAIAREINEPCRRLRPLAVDLVDSFDVPPELLRSPELLSA